MKNSPSLGTNDPPWEFQKVTSLKIFSLGMRTFLAGFCAPGGPLAKAVGIFHEKQPLPGDQRSPLGISKSYLSKNLQPWGCEHFWRVFALLEVLWRKAVGIFHEKQPLPGDQRSPLGISKSYLSKNLQLGDANISGGFLRSWRSSGKSRRDFP